jgi:hypothetical protein
MKSSKNRNNAGSRVLAEDVYVSNDDLGSGLNNNDLVIGGTGTGKTGGYVIPNLSREEGSLVTVDTKGRLYHRFKNVLKAKGYEVYLIDFVYPEQSDGYDPLRFITKRGGRYREKDIEKISRAICSDNNDGMRIKGDEFWDESAETVLSFLIAYTLERKGSEACIADVFDAFRYIQSSTPMTVTSTPKNILYPLAAAKLLERLYGVRCGIKRLPADTNQRETYVQNLLHGEMRRSTDDISDMSDEDLDDLKARGLDASRLIFGDYIIVRLDDDSPRGHIMLSERDEKEIPLEDWLTIHYDSSAKKYWDMFQKVRLANNTWGCITNSLATHLKQFAVDENQEMMSDRGEKRKIVDFTRIGMKKTALFVNVSDSDRSTDKLARVFFLQLFQRLMDTADAQPEGRLPVPVRVYLDDFAAGVVIDDFEKILSVIRSRNISVSIMLQNLTQLETCYGESAANTIVTNCDHIIYLGGQDISTAQYISARADMPLTDILSMKNDEVCIIERGSIGTFHLKTEPYKIKPRKINRKEKAS